MTVIREPWIKKSWAHRWYFDTFCVQMPAGMAVLLYSDGITEALNFDSEEFGIDRLASEFESRCKGNLSTEEILDGLFDVVSSFEVDQHDDRTAIMIRAATPEQTNN